MKTFSLVQQFQGYQNKRDVTNMAAGILVKGSMNVLTTDGERIAARKGYSLLGSENTTDLYGIKGSYEWRTHRGTELDVRAWNDRLEFLYNDDWVTLLEGLSSPDFNFAEYWDTDQQQDALLGVNGDSKILYWNGAYGTVASVSNATGAILGFDTPAFANGGSGYAIGDIVNIGGAGSGGQAKVTAIKNKAVTAINGTPYNIGAGYTVGDVVTLSGGDNNATVHVDTVDGSGGITAATLVSGGTNYSLSYNAGVYFVTGGTGYGAMITITAVGDGTVTGLDLINGGSGYAHASAVATTASTGVGTGLTVNIYSVVQGSITLEGDQTWGELGFSSNGNVVINGVTYSYVGGYNSKTLVGITPDPTGAGITAGMLVFQPPVWIENSAITDLPDEFDNDLIEVLNNQVFIGSLTNREIYISKVNNFRDFGFSAPRIPGEGALITLDATPTAFVPQEDTMYISAGDDQWYNIVFQPASDLTTEALGVKRLKTNTKKAARSQAAVTKIINEIAFVSNEPTFDTLGRVENVTTPQNKAVSDPIKADFDSYDFTGVHTKYFKNMVYIALPAEGIVLIRNLEKGWWEAPQTLPVARFAVINNELYGHSSSTPQTFKLFDGYNDNGAPINARAVFSYMNFGDRINTKNFTEWFTEGYITANTVLLLSLAYDYGGFTQVLETEIKGDDEDILFEIAEDYSLGTHSLGEVSLGGGGGEDNPLPPKFRHIATYANENFFEIQVAYSSDEVDQQWELLAFGPNIKPSNADNTSIKD